MKKMASFILCGWLYLSLVDYVEPARILSIFPLEVKSHFRAFSPLLDELANRGHQVTVYSVIQRGNTLSNYSEVLLKPDSSSPTMKNLDYSGWRKKTVFTYMNDLWTQLPVMVDAVLMTREMQNLIYSHEKYDLVIIEATFGQEHLLAFGHKFNAPVINLHPLFLAPLPAKLAGLPHTFSYIPDFRLPYSDRMTFWQKMKNILVGMYEIVAGELFHIPRMDKRMRQVFNYSGSENLPPLRDMIKDISLWLVDSHYIMSYARPYAPNVIEVAGMTLKTAGKLPLNLQKYMDSASNGVIYFSLGSHIKSSMLTEQQISTFIEVFRKLKQRVIWKWDKEIPNKPENILTGPWFPQVEILGHPNCKLFITHGGFNSLSEVTNIGVPVIGIPIFADQFHNVVYYEEKGIGLGVLLNTLTESELLEKINTVINNPSFSENAKQIANRLNDQPETPLQRAVFWTEYVIRHKGAAHLKPASVYLPYYQYLLLDVIALLILGFSLIVYILIWSIRKTASVLGLTADTVLKKDKQKQKCKKNK